MAWEWVEFLFWPMLHAADDAAGPPIGNRLGLVNLGAEICERDPFLADRTHNLAPKTRSLYRSRARRKFGVVSRLASILPAEDRPAKTVVTVLYRLF